MSEQTTTPDARQILATLRGRVLRGIQGGTLKPGDRLPASREVAEEFGVDYRVAITAYKLLQDEALIELRSRGGVYVAATPDAAAGLSPLPETWLQEVSSAALSRQITLPELPELLRRCLQSVRLRALVVAATEDQVAGLSRELEEDFGLEVDAMTADAMRLENQLLAVRRSDLVVTTAAQSDWLRPLAEGADRQVIVVTVGPEMVTGEWALLLRRPVFAVVATEAFGRMLREFYAKLPGIENLRILVFGRDDLAQIPEDAPTYVTQRVRSQLGDIRIPGRLLPAARTISPDSAREIINFIVRANIAALHGLRAFRTGP